MRVQYCTIRPAEGNNAVNFDNHYPKKNKGPCAFPLSPSCNAKEKLFLVPEHTTAFLRYDATQLPMGYLVPA